MRRSRMFVVAALAGVLIAPLLAAPSVAAPRPAAPQPLLDQRCTATRIATGDARGSAPGRLCVGRLSEAQARAAGFRTGSAAPADAGTQEILPVPDHCDDRLYTWQYTRTNACQYAWWQARMFLDTALIGTLSFSEMSYVYTSTSVGGWTHQLELKYLSATGSLVTGTRVHGWAECVVNCTIDTNDFPSQGISLGSDVEAVGGFDTTVSAAGQVATGDTNMWYYLTHPAATLPTQPVVVDTPAIRCDNATPGASYVGCVLPNVRPVHSILPAGSYAQHIRDAQASGLPGAPGGTPLTRMIDAAKAAQNGRTACPSTYVRPTGFSCDEYPYRSTKEGAFTGGGPGRTFPWCQIPQLGAGSGPRGYSSCMIPATENSSGGGFLSGFYKSNRMLDGDQFFVWVLPVTG